MPNTLVLAGTALLIDFTLGLALGVYQAARARRFGDIALGNAALFVNSMPTFWLGLVLLLVFGQWLHLVPVGGTHDPVLCARLDSLHCVGDRLWHLALPALTLGLVGAAATARYQRAAMLEVIAQDFVRTARAKGLRERRGGPAHPGARRMTAGTWLALAGALVLAFALAAETRRAAAGPAGRRFFRHPTAAPGLVVLAFFVTLALAAPLIAPYPSYLQLDPVHLANQPPSGRFLLGTDPLSRDVWSRLVYGARFSLGIGSLAMLVAVSVRVAVGGVAGYFRRWVDALLMRLVDVGLAIPRVFVLLVVVALWDRVSLPVLVLLIGLTGWFGTSRLVRAEVLSLREREFDVAARALGGGSARVILRHVLPHAAAPIIVSAALGIGSVMLLEAGLSFLGIGVPSPKPSWGNMIADGQDRLAAAPWTSLFPGLAISLVVMALNAVGDALRDALDPHKEAA